ncbi:hypothetical protein [Crystallibacter degradans]|uniref:hypothetical protein n=1 Tax=Crystallibacter degradans TaxID=2726743 RepID=UPI001F0E5841|nr:hypothetical protein [Arthrobacter sp. SF27]
MERRRQIDRYHSNTEAPLQLLVEEPVTYALGIASIHHPSICPLSRSTIVVIRGPDRIQVFV